MARPGQRPRQLEPVTVPYLAAGDSQEAGQRCLGSEQVVMGVVQPAVRQVEADGEQLALVVEQEAEIHALAQGARSARQVAHARHLVGGLHLLAAAAHLVAETAQPAHQLRRLRAQLGCQRCDLLARLLKRAIAVRSKSQRLLSSSRSCAFTLPRARASTIG